MYTGRCLILSLHRDKNCCDHEVWENSKTLISGLLKRLDRTGIKNLGEEYKC